MIVNIKRKKITSSYVVETFNHMVLIIVAF